jgi:NodT family efflux transporter outer membrane factor (OMF) lipoprotein
MRHNNVHCSSHRCFHALLLLISILLGGCATKVGPDFKSPEIAMPEKWQNADKQNMKYIDFREWWKLFNDPTLNQLIDMAYKQNLNLQIAWVRIIEARAQLGLSRGSLFPQKQQVYSEMVYNKLSEHMPNLNTFSFGSFNIGFDALWEVDIWGKFRRGIEAANANLGATELTYDDMLVTLTAEVAATYVQIRTFQQRLILANKNAELQARSVKITQALLRNGLGNDLDVQQAESLLHNTKAMIANLEAGLQQSKNALNILLGKMPGSINLLFNEDKPVPTTVQAITVGIPADILRRRPDVRREELKAAAQSALIGVSRADLFPQLYLQGSIGMASSSANGVDIVDVLGAQTLIGKVGPSVNWPILNYGRLKNGVRIQDARFEQLLIGYKESVLLALRETEDALIGFHKMNEQVKELQQGVDASQHAVKLSILQYRNGIKDYTRVLMAEQTLVQQQDKLKSSQGETARYIIALYKALGGGWDTRLGKDTVSHEIKTEMKKRTDWGNILD